MKLPVHAQSQVSYIIKLYGDRITPQDTLNAQWTYWPEKNTYNEHYSIQICLNGKPFPNQVPTITRGKHAEANARKIGIQMCKEIYKRLDIIPNNPAT